MKISTGAINSTRKGKGKGKGGINSTRKGKGDKSLYVRVKRDIDR
jgi:hypothetical protein